MAIELEIDGKSIVELKGMLRDLRNEIGLATDPAQMQKLAAAAGQVKDKINEVNESVAVFSGGSKFEQAGTALGQVGNSLKNLDFSGAAQQATQLTTIVKGMTFGGAVSGLKELGTTFIQLGKALLTNPIFLLAAAITLIVTGIVALLSKLGLLKPMLDAIKKAIGFVVDAFEALTDWLNLTSNAQEENAERTKKAQEENRKAIEETGKKQEEIYNLTQNLTEEEIKNLEKKLGKELDVAGNIYDIKIKQAKDTEASIAKELETLEVLKKRNGELTEDQQKQYDELKAKQKEANNTIVANERAKVAAIQDINKKSMDTLKSWQIKNIADANERSKAELKIEEEKALRAIDLEIKKAKGLGASTKELEQTKLEITKFFNNETVKIDKEVQKQRADAVQAANDKAKSKEEKRLAELAKKTKAQLDQLIYDEGLKVKATEEGSAARLAAESALYDKQIQFYNDNFKNLQITELEKNKAIDKLNEDKLKGIKVFNEKEEAENKKKNDAIFQAQQKIDQNALEIRRLGLKQLEDLETDSTAVRIDKSIQREQQLKAIEKTALDENIQNLKKQLEDKLISQEQYDSDLILLTEQSQSVITDIEKSEADTRLKIAEDEKTKRKEDLEETLQAYQQIIDALQSIRGEGNALAVDLISTSLGGIKTFTELANKEFENASEKAAAYAQAIGGIMSSVVAAISESSQQRSEESLARVEQNSAREQEILDNQLQQGLISQEQYDAQSQALAQGSNKQMEAIRKKAFEDDKKAKIAQATIAGLMGAVSAFTGAMQLGPIAGPIVGGILAAAVGALTAVNISKIQSQQYSGGGGGGAAGGAGSIGGLGGASTGNQSAVPSFNLFGQGNNANTTNASAPVMGGGQQGPMLVKAVVVESDITNSQANVARYNESATL
jgi:DNA repair exonuclease SbcCD ATPase subunit